MSRTTHTVLLSTHNTSSYTSSAFMADCVIMLNTNVTLHEMPPGLDGCKAELTMQLPFIYNL